MKRMQLVIDETLLEEALRLTGLETDSEVVHLALEELLRRKKPADHRASISTPDDHIQTGTRRGPL